MSYAAGSSPVGMVTGDFNNDTVLDLAVANSPDDTVSVLLGSPGGTFQAARNSGTGYDPDSPAVGDFNGDGNLDLATINYYGASVSVLLGNSNGTFLVPTVTYLGSGPESLAVGDFNADGRLDLVVVSHDGNEYTAVYANVLLGTGDGSFSGPSPTGLGYNIHVSAAVADFNGDGKLDLATARYDTTYYGPHHETVSLLLGDGLGNLQPPTDFSAGAELARSVTAGDVNGDAHTDLVLSNDYALSVLLGDGLGSFGSAHTYVAGYSPSSVVLGDFNRDDQVDLLLTTINDAYTGREVTALLGTGGGAFSAPRNFATAFDTGAVVAGDFNADGWLDAATTNRNSDGVSVLMNDTHWSPADAPSVTISDVTVTEGNTGTVGATFTVSLSAAYGQPVTVHYATADGTATAGSDYQAASGTLTFAPGETSKAVPVQVIGDRLPEANETFSITLSAATSGLIVDGQGVATIVDDEPRISIGDVSTKEGKKGQTTSFTFTVTLSAAYDQPVTVSFKTSDGTAKASDSDYVARTGTLTFNPGETTKSITITVNGDSKKEADETFSLDLFGSTSNSLLTRQRGIGTILNDD